MSESIQKIQEVIIEGRHKEIKPPVREIRKKGISLVKVIQEGLIAAMDVVGRECGKEILHVGKQ